MYLIDGHNLIGQLDDLSLSDANDEVKLIQKLTGFAARVSKRIVVVFDNGITGGRSRLSTYTVEVIWARQGSSADRLLQERIQDAKDPQQYVVVSSDREVLSYAQERRMQAVRSVDFARLLKPNVVPDKDSAIKLDYYPTPKEVMMWLQIFNNAALEDPTQPVDLAALFEEPPADDFVARYGKKKKWKGIN